MLEEFVTQLIRVKRLCNEKGLPFDAGVVITQIHLENKARNEDALRRSRLDHERGLLKGNKLLGIKNDWGKNKAMR